MRNNIILSIRLVFFLSTGGNVGIMSPLFASSFPAGPPKSWEDPMSYPAINGQTLIENVTFAKFGTGCDGWRNRALMTSPKYGDIIHPTNLRKISLENVEEDSKVCSCENILSLLGFFHSQYNIPQ